MKPHIGEDFVHPMHEEKIAAEKAVVIAKSLLMCMQVQHVSVNITFSARVYRRRWGTCFYDKPLEYRINLYSKGQNVGTLVHELAHVVNKVQTGRLGHTPMFGVYHARMLWTAMMLLRKDPWFAIPHISPQLKELAACRAR